MKKTSLSRRSLVIAGIIIILVLLGGSLYWYNHQSVTPQDKALAENQAIMKEVASHIMVPSEEPVIATISEENINKLMQEQPFYNGSQVGDKLIIFPQAQRAIIYSPMRKIVVNSGPFVVSSPKTPAAPVAPATPKK